MGSYRETLKVWILNVYNLKQSRQLTMTTATQERLPSTMNDRSIYSIIDSDEPWKGRMLFTGNKIHMYWINFHFHQSLYLIRISKINTVKHLFDVIYHVC